MACLCAAFLGIPIAWLRTGGGEGSLERLARLGFREAAGPGCYRVPALAPWGGSLPRACPLMLWVNMSKVLGTMSTWGVYVCFLIIQTLHFCEFPARIIRNAPCFQSWFTSIPHGLGKGWYYWPLKKHDMQLEKSCLMNLLMFSEGENKCEKKGKPVDILNLDFQNTFARTSCQRSLNVESPTTFCVEVSLRRNMTKTHLLNCLKSSLCLKNNF